MWEVQIQTSTGWKVVAEVATEAEAIALRQAYILAGKHAAIYNTSGITNDTSVYSSSSPTIDSLGRVNARINANSNAGTTSTVSGATTSTPVNKPMIATIITFIVILGIAATYKS